MPFNTDSYILESAAAADSLPDPTTVSSRTHWLTNTGSVATVWSSVGATPFTDASGTNVATLTVPAGGAMQVHSDGVHWVVTSSSTAQRRVFAGSGVTNASGDVTLNFVPAFPSTPDVTQAVQTTNTNVTEARITALSASSVTVNVRQSPAVVVLGISVLAVPQPLAGATVHVLATLPGQGI